MNLHQVAGHALLGVAAVPEPGSWYRVDGTLDGVPLWARVPAEEGHEDADALRVAWERLSHLDHPGIPRAVKLAEEGRALLVAAPDGIPLSRLLDHRHDEVFTMTPGTVLDVGAALSELLVHAHERGRPHGHLSPDVVWVTAEGRLVVWGFAAGPEAPCAARWWSPERARGKRTSGDADQWALGALLASLVTGRLPWRAEDVISEARIGDTTHLSAPVVEQWKPLGRLVERALAAERGERFPSIHPIRQGLDALRQRVGQSSDLPRMAVALHGLFTPTPPPPLMFSVEDLPPPDEDDVPTSPPDDTLTMPAVTGRPPPESLSPPAVILQGTKTLSTDGFLDPAQFDTFDAGTERPTSPTRVPTDLHDAPSVVGPEDLPVLPMGALGGVSVPVEIGDEPSLPSSAFEPTTSATAVPHVSDARRDRTHVEPEWYEKVDMRRYAPFTVGLMVIVLGGYVVWAWLL